MLNQIRPYFPKDVYERWIKQRIGTEEQRRRYKAAIEWYKAHPEQGIMTNQPKSKSKLESILSGLLAQASASPGKAARKQLAGGLRVDVLVKAGITRLQLSREGVYPSNVEWHTTLKNWPITIYAEPERKEYQGRCYLTASWKIHPEK